MPLPAKLTTLLSEPPAKQQGWYKYGMLGVCLVLFVVHAWMEVQYRSDTFVAFFRRFAVVFLLLAFHLAFVFTWSRQMTILLRVTALVLVVAGVALIFTGF